MRYSLSQTARAFCEIVKDSAPAESDTVVERFTALVQERHLADNLEEIVNAVRKQWKKAVADRQAAVTVAREAPWLKKKIQQELEQFDVVTKVDPTILGGAVIRVGDRLLDGSIKTKLERLRNILQK